MLIIILNILFVLILTLPERNLFFLNIYSVSGRVTGELEVMKRRVKELTELQDVHGQNGAKRIAEYEERLQISEKQRRKLHNLVQELRGNIRVFARVRPFLPSDGMNNNNGSGNNNSTITTTTETNSIRITKVNETENRVEDHSFQFDKIFGQSSSQESVFQEVSEFVQSALDGYNVCLFSYGQTGSGKVRGYIYYYCYYYDCC